MSPLLNRLASIGWPETAESWGLVIGARDIAACQLSRGAEGWQITAARHAASPVPLFQGTPAEGLAESLAPLLATVAAEAANRFVPMCVAVPDAAVSVNVFELDVMPRSLSEREALARWNLEKLGHAGTDYECRTQDLGAAGDKSLLLVTAMQRSWLDTLRQACQQAHLVPTQWQAGMFYRFNHFHDQIVQSGKDGALLSIDPDAWSLLLWDATGRIRFARARWRNRDTVDDTDSIAVETERTIRAYVHGDRSRRLQAVMLHGEDGLVHTVTERLNSRMQTACIPLTSLPGTEAAEGVSLSFPGAALACTTAMGFES